MLMFACSNVDIELSTYLDLFITPVQYEVPRMVGVHTLNLYT